MLSLESIRRSVVVAEDANFTRAAERVHVSQSGVSAQIHQLERDLGAALREFLVHNRRAFTGPSIGQPAG